MDVGWWPGISLYVCVCGGGAILALLAPLRVCVLSGLCWGLVWFGQREGVSGCGGT